jgi:AcrR family transcriptional regulator
MSVDPPGRASARPDVLAKAAARASTEGLEGLTIGRLAASLGMSKSGVVGLFGSKADLQVATLRSAGDRFQREVIDKARAEPGVARLRELLHLWLNHITTAYPGGCFFSAAAAELDDRPGPARDELIALERRWIAHLESEARLAIRLGELPKSLNPHQLVFELFSVLLGFNFWNRLLGDPDAVSRAHQAIDRALGDRP